MPAQSGCPFLGQRSFGDHAPEARDRDGTGREDSTWAEARAYLQLYHREKQIPDRLAGRLEAVRREIERTGTYWQTVGELAHGARVAWRNSNRCIGRLYWESLQLRDMRHLATEEEIFVSCVEHLRVACNAGPPHQNSDGT
jgi:nitric-oxide synthase, bacterial